MTFVSIVAITVDNKIMKNLKLAYVVQFLSAFSFQNGLKWTCHKED